ncbi:MAG: hypothetical protein AAF629_12315 [Chloroflexota bacterium]
MSTTVNYKPAAQSNLNIVGIIAIVALILGIIALVSNSCTQSTSGQALIEAADQLDALAETSINYTVMVDETISVNTEVTLNQEVTVPLDTVVMQEVAANVDLPLGELVIPIDTTVAFNDVLEVPVTVNIDDLIPAGLMEMPAQELALPLDLVADQVLPLNTAVIDDQPVELPLNVTVDQDFLVQTEMLGQVITVPLSLDLTNQVLAQAQVSVGEAVNVPLGVALDAAIEGDMSQANYADLELVVPIPTAGEALSLLPPNQRSMTFNVPVTIDAEFPINVEAPVSVSEDGTLAVEINNLELPLKTEVNIPINQTVPVTVDVPVVLEIPIEIPLADTSFGEALKSIATSMRNAAQ